MPLKEYFDSKEGKSVLSSANADGMVTSAIYSKPHVFDDGTIAFVMRERLTHENLKTNPYASYMFIEEGHGHKGIRLYLKKIKEDADNELIEKMKRRHLTPEEDHAKGPKFLVHFTVDKILPLIGEGDTATTLRQRMFHSCKSRSLREDFRLRISAVGRDYKLETFQTPPISRAKAFAF